MNKEKEKICDKGAHLFFIALHFSYHLFPLLWGSCLSVRRQENKHRLLGAWDTWAGRWFIQPLHFTDKRKKKKNTRLVNINKNHPCGLPSCVMASSLFVFIYLYLGFPHSSVGKESACNAGDPGLIPGLGTSYGEGNVNPPQYSCLENPMDRGAWQATVHGFARVGHDLATKPPPLIFSFFVYSWPPNTALQDLSSLTRDWTSDSYSGSGVLAIHWTTKGFPIMASSLTQDESFI